MIFEVGDIVVHIKTGVVGVIKAKLDNMYSIAYPKNDVMWCHSRFPDAVRLATPTEKVLYGKNTTNDR